MIELQTEYSRHLIDSMLPSQLSGGYPTNVKAK
jgi:hypothetical protein